MYVITTIIVTFNRREELFNCIHSVLTQTYKTTHLLIIDNASKDNTFKFICEKIYNDSSPSLLIDELTILPKINGINIIYQYCGTNSGGAGGFYTGLKIANTELHSDYFWLMDDDGYPSKNCLETLLSIVDKYDYVMPISCDIADNTKLSWPIRKSNGKRTIDYSVLHESWGDIMNYVVPFNGALLTKACIKQVGYINRDFFIWGDDYEHYWRCKKNNINPVTIMNAIFYHPAQKISLVSICFGLFELPYVESKLRMICLVRNSTYIYLHYEKKIKIFIKFLMYSWLFLFTRKFDLNGYKLYLLSVGDAFKNDFTRHLKYI